MQVICERLEKQGVCLSEFRALEMFAREGNWQTLSYVNKVKSIEAWEIDPKFEQGLKKNLPTAKIRIADSHKEAKNNRNFSKYDFIVIDNPQGCYGQIDTYCEHFDAIIHIPNLIDYRGIVIFNINKEPFDFDRQIVWQKRRSEFYRINDTRKISISFLLRYYESFFLEFGYCTEFCFDVPRNDFIHYLVYFIRPLA
jgi:hypothetical protein